MSTSAHHAHFERDAFDYDGFLWRVLNDATFRADMSYCYARGIPFSEYQGRRVRRGESRWTPLDRARVRAWQRYTAECCPTCGVHPIEYPRPTLDVPTYEPEPVVCFVCAEVERADEFLREQNKDKRPPRGMRMQLRRRPDAEVAPGLHTPPLKSRSMLDEEGHEH